MIYEVKLYHFNIMKHSFVSYKSLRLFKSVDGIKESRGNVLKNPRRCLQTPCLWVRREILEYFLLTGHMGINI